MKTARIDIRLEPELLTAIDEARGDVPRQLWMTRAVEERLQAEGYELDLNHEPAQVVPIRPGVKVKQPPKKTKARRDEPKQRKRPTGTWRT